MYAREKAGVVFESAEEITAYRRERNDCNIMGAALLVAFGGMEPNLFSILAALIEDAKTLELCLEVPNRAMVTWRLGHKDKA